MTNLPPNWAFKIYSKLWKEYQDKKFTKKQAETIVKDNNLSQCLSRLKNHSWLKIELDTKDSRKHIYTLKDPSIAIKEVIEANG